MSRPNPSEAIQNAVNGALQWFDEVKDEGITYLRHDPDKQFFIEDPKGVTWYRFYEIGTNKPVFSGRDGVIKYDLREIEEERQYGYTWAGSFAKRILEVASSTGYFEGQSYAQVVKDDSTSIDGKTLHVGDLVKVMK
jgi:PelA/Pel-15E family pectate lyase